MRMIQKQIKRRDAAAPASAQEIRPFDRSKLDRTDRILALIEEITNKRR
jgi:hypothetical protein